MREFWSEPLYEYAHPRSDGRCFRLQRRHLVWEIEWKQEPPELIWCVPGQIRGLTGNMDELTTAHRPPPGGCPTCGSVWVCYENLGFHLFKSGSPLRLSLATIRQLVVFANERGDLEARGPGLWTAPNAVHLRCFEDHRVVGYVPVAELVIPPPDVVPKRSFGRYEE